MTQVDQHPQAGPSAGQRHAASGHLKPHAKLTMNANWKQMDDTWELFNFAHLFGVGQPEVIQVSIFSHHTLDPTKHEAGKMRKRGRNVIIK